MEAVRMVARAILRAQWRASLGLALLLALVGGMVLAATAGARRTDTAYSRLLNSTAAADVDAAVSDADARQNVGGLAGYYADLARLPDVETVAPIIGIDAVVAGGDHTPVIVKAAADDRMYRAVERPKLVAGRMFTASRADEVVADRTVAARLHLHVGSTVHLVVRPTVPTGTASDATRLDVRVVGIAVTRDNVIPINELAGEPAFLASPALLRTVPRDAYLFDSALVRLRPGASIADFRTGARALLADHPETGGHLFVVDERRQAAAVEEGIRPEAVALILFALLVALTGVLVLRQILVRQVFLSASEQPTLRALGLGRPQRMAIGMVPVVVTAVVGAVLAVVAAAVLSSWTPIGPARVAEPHPGLEVNAAILGLGALAMVIVLVLLVAPSAWRLAGGTAEPESARASGLARPSRVLERLTRTGAPVTTIVGARLALEPGRGRTAVPTRSTVVGAVVAIVAVAGAFTFGTNMVRMVETPRLYGQTWQLSTDFDFATVPRADAAAFLRRQPGVTGWTFGNHTEVTVAGSHAPAVGIAAGRGRPRFPTLLEGRQPRNDDEIVLGTDTLARADGHVGERVAVTLPGAGSPRSLLVVGRAVFPFFGQGEVTPTGLGEGAAYLDPSPHPAEFNFFLVDVSSGSRQQARVRHLAHAVRASGLCGDCRTTVRQRPADVTNYARIERTPLLLAGVLGVLAVALVAHLLVTSIRRRRRDLAILKTLGFRRHQLSAAVAWQATIVTAIALVIGLPLGVLAGVAAWGFFATRLGVAPDPQVPVLVVLVAIPVALVIANAVAAAPAWAARNLRAASVLSTE